MAAGTSGPSPVGRSLRLALVMLFGVALMLSVVEFADFAQVGGPYVWLFSLFTVAALVYTVAGLTGWWLRPSNRIGAITVVGGAVLFACALANTSSTALVGIGVVLASVPLAVITWLLLAFPAGRLGTTLTRVTVLVGFGVCTLLEAPRYLFDATLSPDGALAVSDHPALATAALWAQRVVGSGVVLTTVAVLGHRLRRANPEQRRVLALLYGWGIVALLVAILAPDILEPLLGVSTTTRAVIQLVALAVVPLAFTAAALTHRFAPTSELQELGDWLAAPATARPAVEDALCRALGDRSARLAYWSDARAEFVDENGAPLPAAPERGNVPVETGDRIVGLISYDPRLNADPEFVRAAGRVVAIAIDRDRLTADLRASQRALQLSRQRIVDAADRERHRIAHDLHDGMQAQLVAIGLHAQQLAGRPDATEAIHTAATALRVDIDAAARQLRELVHQVMPAALIERGLRAAIEDLVDRMPVPTRLEAGTGDDELPDSVQRSAYFIVAEALTNAVRHAHATRLLVRIHTTPTALCIEVIDDGVGGARISGGLGLRGLADRVDVHCGRLQLRSPPGGGTHVTAELSCAS